MDCLVITVPGTATDDTLRRLDEFRFSAIPAGNKLGYAELTMVIKPMKADSNPVKLKIVKGAGELSTASGIAEQQLVFENYGSTNVVVKAFLRVTSKCLLGIENCRHIIQLGSYESGSASFFDRQSSIDSPIISMDISELRLFRNCTSLFINTAGQETDFKGDISVFKGFAASRIRLTGSSTKISPITGDISVFEGDTKFELRFDFTRIYGTIPDSFVSLFRFDSRGGKIEGDLNKFGSNLTTLFHSTTSTPIDAIFTYDFSAATPKPNGLFLVDVVGGAMSGEFSDAFVASSTAGVNIACNSVSSPVNTDIYEVLRRIANRQVTNLTANFGETSTYSFSGSISGMQNSFGIGLFSIISNNIPDENAIAILDYINRSTINNSLTKVISLRCDSSNSQISSLIAQLQTKGYTVVIYPLI